ncbi:hypothetical protein [Paraburkholderia sp. J76]|uniref:hypothetical protein n=1 Tax=Paraburkholderia sp. J76 TaxID=2805439 RepID=UPI002ABD389A|nr:hypothetical protein [Paraburkholderia sp. J76]
MIETPAPEQPGERPQHEQVDEIVADGPGGALAVAGIATLIVAAIWFIFYFVVFLPRGVIQ